MVYSARLCTGEHTLGPYSRIGWWEAITLCIWRSDNITSTIISGHIARCCSLSSLLSTNVIKVGTPRTHTGTHWDTLGLVMVNKMERRRGEETPLVSARLCLINETRCQSSSSPPIWQGRGRREGRLRYQTFVLSCLVLLEMSSITKNKKPAWNTFSFAQ